MVSMLVARRGSGHPGRCRQRRGDGILAGSRLAGRPLQLRPAPCCSQAWSVARVGGGIVRAAKTLVLGCWSGPGVEDSGWRVRFWETVGEVWGVCKSLSLAWHGDLGQLGRVDSETSGFSWT